MTSTITNIIYRIQDKDGRGPYKPGMSIKWCDEEGHYSGDYTNLPPFMDEFGPSVLDELNLIISVSGGACGCGFRSMEELHNWFSPTELERLKALGYSIVRIEAKKIIRSSHRQTVFWCDKPLRKAAEVAA